MMENEKEHIQIHYDWKYMALMNLIKFAKWAVSILIILYILYLLLNYAPVWLLSMVLGAAIFAVPCYLFVRSFFKIDYLIFLHVDLEKRLIIPYYVPKKLILEGEWELEGVKTKYKSAEGMIDDAEIERIFKEAQKIDKKIRDLEEKREYLNALKLLTFKDLQYKKTYKRWKLYNIFGFNLIAKYPILERFPIIVRRKNNYKRYEEIKRELTIIKQKIKELKAAKNQLLLNLEWSGLEGGEIYFIDDINKKERKIYLSPLHQCSDLELQLNKHKIAELKAKLSSIIREYAKLKINYEDEIMLKAIDLIEELSKDEKDEENGDVVEQQ